MAGVHSSFPSERPARLSSLNQSNSGPIFHAFTRPPTKHTDELLLLPTFQQTCPEKSKFSRSTTSAVQLSAGHPSSHSFHGEVSSPGRLPLSIPLVQLCAAHTPKTRRARFRALRLRSAPGIDSASLRSFPRHL